MSPGYVARSRHVLRPSGPRCASKVRRRHRMHEGRCSRAVRITGTVQCEGQIPLLGWYAKNSPRTTAKTPGSYGAGVQFVKTQPGVPLGDVRGEGSADGVRQLVPSVSDVARGPDPRRELIEGGRRQNGRLAGVGAVSVDFDLREPERRLRRTGALLPRSMHSHDQGSVGLSQFSRIATGTTLVPIPAELEHSP